MSAPLVLHLPSARAYAVVMAVLLVLFLARVIGQFLAATTAPRWLPPMARWYSGLMPYRHLLPTPIVIAAISPRNTSWVGSRYRYGMSPEYQRAIGGSHAGAVVAARI